MYFVLIQHQYKIIQYNTLNVNSQLNKLKSGIKNCIEVTLNLSSNLIGDSNDETNFLYKLLLTDRHVLKLHEAFVDYSSVNIKLSKKRLSKIMQSGRIIDDLVEEKVYYY